MTLSETSHWAIVVVIVIALSFATGAFAQAGLIEHLPLDGNGTALVGTDGTLVNGPTSAVDRLGNANGALAFSGGSQQYVTVAGGGGLNNLQTGTISMYVKWTGPQAAGCGQCGSNATVLSRQKNNVFSNDVIGLSGTDPATARVTWQPYAAGFPAITGSTAIGDGQWHHVVITFSSGSHVLYLDGVVDGMSTATGTVGDSVSTPLVIGAWLDDGHTYSTSVIDDFKVFSRVLTQAEIQGMNAPTPTPTMTVTSTPTTTSTSTESPTATRTDTATATATAMPTDTPTATATDTPTCTATPTSTATAIDTATDTPTNTPTSTPTATETSTPAVTSTSTPTATLAAGCPAVPLNTCFSAGKSIVKLKLNPALYTFSWKWKAGALPLAQTDFGDPLNGTTSYAMCLYDYADGSPMLKMGVTVEPGPCGTGSGECWHALGTSGWNYKDSQGNVQGVTKLFLKGGDAGKPKLQLKGVGASFPFPTPVSGSAIFAQDPDVTIQLHSSSPANCWSSTFNGAKKNDGVQFKAKAP